MRGPGPTVLSNSAKLARISHHRHKRGFQNSIEVEELDRHPKKMLDIVSLK